MPCAEMWWISEHTKMKKTECSGASDFWSKMAVCALGAATAFGELFSGLEILMILA